jgi:hypothetical protein
MALDKMGVRGALRRGPSMTRMEASKVASAMKLGLFSDSPAARTLVP